MARVISAAKSSRWFPGDDAASSRRTGSSSFQSCPAPPLLIPKIHSPPCVLLGNSLSPASPPDQQFRPRRVAAGRASTRTCRS